MKAGERETGTGLLDYGHSRRTNNLPWNAAANEAPTFSTSAPSGQSDTRRPRSKDSSILITRLFTIDASDIIIPPCQDSARPPGETEAHHSDSPHSEQPPQITEGAAIKQIKCPTYALSIVLQAASTTQQGWPSALRVTSQASAQAESPLEPPAQEQWSQAGAANQFAHGSDCSIEQVTCYWTALTRLLCSLEDGFQQRIGDALGSVVKDLRLRPLPDFQPTTTVLRDTASPPVKKKLQPSQRLIQLPVNALQHSESVRQLAKVVWAYGEKKLDGSADGLAVKIKTSSSINFSQHSSDLIWSGSIPLILYGHADLIQELNDTEMPVLAA
ncbi:MAG: hypothetical protein Q9183_006670 [Haloplaca sp. 2 TL-2023]